MARTFPHVPICVGAPAFLHILHAGSRRNALRALLSPSQPPFPRLKGFQILKDGNWLSVTGGFEHISELSNYALIDHIVLFKGLSEYQTLVKQV